MNYFSMTSFCFVPYYKKKIWKMATVILEKSFVMPNLTVACAFPQDDMQTIWHDTAKKESLKKLTWRQLNEHEYNYVILQWTMHKT